MRHVEITVTLQRNWYFIIHVPHTEVKMLYVSASVCACVCVGGGDIYSSADNAVVP